MKTKFLFVVALCMSAISAFAQSEESNLRKQMETIFAKWDKVVMGDSVAAAWPFFHKGYYLVDTEGRRMNFPEFKQMVIQMSKSAKMVSSRTRIWNVQLQEQEAVVWVQNEMVWKEQAGGKWSTKKSTTRWAENLVRGGIHGWQFRSSQQLMTNEPWTFKTTGGG
jgi:hypothetical protein